MKKIVTIIIILSALAHITTAQDAYLTELSHNLSLAKDDTSRVSAMVDFSNYYKGTKPDSALIYGYQALELSRKIKYHDGEFDALEILIITQGGLGNETKALQLYFQA